jgi:hypothetical protein
LLDHLIPDSPLAQDPHRQVVKIDIESIHTAISQQLDQLRSNAFHFHGIDNREWANEKRNLVAQPCLFKKRELETTSRRCSCLCRGDMELVSRVMSCPAARQALHLGKSEFPWVKAAIKSVNFGESKARQMWSPLLNDARFTD